MIFEWHVAKAASNLRKHGVSFAEATAVFLDPLALTFPDPYDQGGEGREITIGHTPRNLVIFVSHCLRGEHIRVISARRATRREQRQYEEGTTQTIE